MNEKRGDLTWDDAVELDEEVEVEEQAVEDE